MIDFTKLLVHSADLFVRTDVNTGGRITETWTKSYTLPCRFSSPASTRVSPVAGASIEQVDATIFTGPELLTISNPSMIPLRFRTTEPGWAATYEMRTKPRIIYGDRRAVHHCECDVVEVQAP